MRNLHNIEKSAFRRGEYVGYGAGLVWRIKRSNSSFGNWVAIANDRPRGCPDVYAFTLEGMSGRLDTLVAHMAAAANCN